MSPTQWILNIALLAWVLLRNLGTRPLDRSFVVVPLLVVGVAAGIYLRDVPTAGNDVFLEVVFAAALRSIGDPFGTSRSTSAIPRRSRACPPSSDSQNST